MQHAQTDGRTTFLSKFGVKALHFEHRSLDWQFGRYHSTGKLPALAGSPPPENVGGQIYNTIQRRNLMSTNSSVDNIFTGVKVLK